MEDIITIIVALIAVDLVILMLKSYGESTMKEKTISWKVIAIIQIPILVMIYLFLTSFQIAFIILVSAMVICIVLGLFLNFKGKKSATEPIQAEIIDINCINYGRNRPIYMYTLTVKYTINGMDYISKNTKGYSELDENMKIGNKIMIKYNPKNPNDIAMP